MTYVLDGMNAAVDELIERLNDGEYSVDAKEHAIQVFKEQLLDGLNDREVAGAELLAARAVKRLRQGIMTYH